MGGDYWYENRNSLRPGMCFVDAEGDTVQLTERVPGDGSKWYCALWRSKWLYEDLTVEPGDLVEMIPEPQQGGDEK